MNRAARSRDQISVNRSVHVAGRRWRVGSVTSSCSCDFSPIPGGSAYERLSGVSNLGADDRSCVNLTDDWYVRQYSRSLLAARGSTPLDLDPSSEGSSTHISHRTLLRRASRVLFGIGIIEERNRDRRKGLIETDWPFLIFVYRSLFLTRPPWLSRVFSDS